MKHSRTRQLFTYWNDLRHGRLAPYRSEVDPRAIAPLLESTFILESSEAGTPRFRLAGTRLCGQFGLELRGMSALALWHGDCRNRLRALLSNVLTEPCIGHIGCTVETRGGHLFDAEFLYLPLRSDLGEVTRILGCGFYMDGFDHTRPGHEPIHHWIDSVNAYPIDAPDEDRQGQASPIRDVAATVEAAMATRRRSDRPAARPRVRPMLRAIDGGLDSSPVVDFERRRERAKDQNFLRVVKS